MFNLPLEIEVGVAASDRVLFSPITRTEKLPAVVVRDMWGDLAVAILTPSGPTSPGVYCGDLPIVSARDMRPAKQETVTKEENEDSDNER